MPPPRLKGNKVRTAMAELCQAILHGRQFRDANEQIETFLNDDDAKQAYVDYTRRRAELQDRRARGFELTAGQVDGLERLHKDLLANPVTKGFLEASEELETLKVAVVQWIEKAFELNRVPTEKDFEEDEED